MIGLIGNIRVYT